MRMKLLLLCVVGVVTGVPMGEDSPGRSDDCPYHSCTEYDPNVLNVHIVAHTHDDVGWLKTVDQYYYGSSNDIQKAGVQYILDSVIKELWEDPKRKFVYIETAFFWKWWTRQPESIRQKVHTLVREGRLQFSGGAWSMNDEAASHYQSTIDQFTYGLSKLNKTFGPCARPHVGWQIDPFGHSRELASLLAGMGYDGLFLGRIDYQDKNSRLDNKNMEMLWRGDDDLGKPSDIFTGVLYNTYSPPRGFCFDILCSDEPIIDDPESPIFNVDARVSQFLERCSNMSQAYRSNNILVTMGDDFNYQDAGMWFTNLDKLIEYTNIKAAQENLNVKVYYSTPNCYLKAVKEANPTLPTKQDDFFPYASDEHSYWTGYFTSRPTTKFFEREANAYLQMVKQLQSLADLEEHNQFVINELSAAMGVMQHHDAITGTEKQHVTHDYERLLNSAVDDALLVARLAINKYLQGDALKPPILTFERCRFNESSCAVSEKSHQFVVSVYNPLAWEVNEIIRVPVLEGNYQVFAPNGDQIQSQLVDIPQAVADIPTRHSQASHEIFFLAKLHPVSFKTFYVRKVKAKRLPRDAAYFKVRNSKFETNYLNYNEIPKRERKWDDFHSYNQVPRRENVYEFGQRSEFPQRKYSGFTKRDQRSNFPNNRETDFNNREPNNRKVNTDFANRYSEFSNREELDRNDYGNSLKRSKDDFDSDTVYFENGKVSVPTRKMIAISMADETEDRDVDKLSKIIKNRNKHKFRKVDFRMNDEVMEMLGDDPMVVERYEGVDPMLPLRYSGENVVGYQDLKIRLNDFGEPTHVTLKDGTDIKFAVQFSYYPGTVGNNEIPNLRSSGAYIFRPNATEPVFLKFNVTEGAQGPVVKEVRMNVDENVHNTIRIYKDLNFIESEWVVGPIDISDDVGKEYIVKYVTNFVNNGEFYTDSNGRQMLKRQLNKRPQWNVSIEEPVAGNYYPITNRIYINGDRYRLSVLTDRSQGGSSLTEGEIEVMLHRRLLHDDAFGVGEALNEIANGKGLVVRGRHRIIVSDSDNNNDCIKERKQVLQFHLQPIVLVADASKMTLDEWKTLNNRSFSWTHSLPEGLHLLTVEPIGDKKLILRLENYLEVGDQDNTTLEVDLAAIFKTITVKSFKETMLAANVFAEEFNKWSWNKENRFSMNFNDENDKFEAESEIDNFRDDGFKIRVKAKQIRTFIVNYDVK